MIITIAISLWLGYIALFGIDVNVKGKIKCKRKCKHCNKQCKEE